MSARGRRPRRPGRASVGALAAFLAACAGSAPSEVEERADALSRARSLWEAAGMESYSYVLTRQCFCVETATGPGEVRVEEGVVTAVTRLDSGEDLPAEYFPSVEGLFELVEEAIERGAYRVDVSYDPALGVPVRIWIDDLETAVDEELGFEATLPRPPG